MKTEIDLLNTIKIGKEDKFKYISLTGEKKLLKVDNDENIPYNILYTEENCDPNEPIIDINNINYNNALNEKILGLELYKEECFDDSDEKLFCLYKNGKSIKKGIVGQIIYFIIICGINFIFVIAAYATLIKDDKYYIAYRNYILGHTFGINYIFIPSYLALNLSPYEKFWCNLPLAETAILMGCFVSLIAYIIFQVLFCFGHMKKIKLFDLNNKKTYSIVLQVNIYYYIIFMIFIPLSFYLFVYSVIVTATSPSQVKDSFSTDKSNNKFDKDWKDNKTLPIVNCVIKFIIFCIYTKLSGIKYLIVRYLNKDYEEDSNNDQEKDKEKTTKIKINDVEYNVSIKFNERLYIKTINNGKINKFLKVKIDNIMNDYVYVKTGINAISEVLSIAEVDYPYFNETINKLSLMANQTYKLLFLSIPLFYLLINDEIMYKVLSSDLGAIYDMAGEKKPLFYDIFRYYGDFEKSNIQARFALYVIFIFFILLYILKEILLGEFNNYCLYKITFIIFICFSIQNIIYSILNFLLSLFGLLSLISYYVEFIYLDHPIIQAKLIIQIVFNFAIFIMTIKLSNNSVKFCTHLNEIRKDFKNFLEGKTSNEGDKQNQQEFEYISLNDKIKTLKEFRNDGILQRYLYYQMDEENIINTEIININGNNNQIDKDQTSLDKKSNTNNNMENRILIDDNINIGTTEKFN
jgi:hypothetical protein